MTPTLVNLKPEFERSMNVSCIVNACTAETDCKLEHICPFHQLKSWDFVNRWETMCHNMFVSKLHISSSHKRFPIRCSIANH